MTRRTGKEGLHSRGGQDRRSAETLSEVASEIREAESMRLADLERESGWLGAGELQAEVTRLRALLARCADALEAVPDPSSNDLVLIEEARRG